MNPGLWLQNLRCNVLDPGSWTQGPVSKISVRDPGPWNTPSAVHGQQSKGDRRQVVQLPGSGRLAGCRQSGWRRQLGGIKRLCWRRETKILYPWNVKRKGVFGTGNIAEWNSLDKKKRNETPLLCQWSVRWPASHTIARPECTCNIRLRKLWTKTCLQYQLPLYAQLQQSVSAMHDCELEVQHRDWQKLLVAGSPTSP